MIRKYAYGWILGILLVSLAGPTAAASQRMAVKADIANIRARPEIKSDTLWQVEKYYPPG